MSFLLLNELCESHLIPSKPSLKQWDGDDLRELAYLYFLALRMLLGHEETRDYARRYVEKTIRANNFDSWRSDGNDLYAILYALSSEDDFKSSTGISLPAVRDWMQHTQSKDFDARTQKLFNRLDGMFGIHKAALKSLRRTVTHWAADDSRERDDVLVKVIQQIQRITHKSELLPKLKKLSKQFRQDDDDLNESASAGATGAASVATAVGTLGAGFDPDGDWRSVYGPRKPVVIKRTTESVDDDPTE